MEMGAMEKWRSSLKDGGINTLSTLWQGHKRVKKSSLYLSIPSEYFKQFLKQTLQSPNTSSQGFTKRTLLKNHQTLGPKKTVEIERKKIQETEQRKGNLTCIKL